MATGYFIDTHTHLYVEEFDFDRIDVMERAQLAGATRLLLPNIDEASLVPMLQMCQDYPQLCCPMIGLHPTELPENFTETLERMELMLQNEHHPFVAVGEVGIDLYWDSSRKDEQVEAFRRQIEWAVQYHLPLVVHTRSAHCEVVKTMQPFASILEGGVFHCFGGTLDEASELLSLFPNFCLGIGGVVTFKKSNLPMILKNVVPLDRVVLETDSPYLAPTPHRGKRNESAYIPFIIEKLSEIYEVSVSEVAAITTLNASRVFKLS